MSEHTPGPWYHDNGVVFIDTRKQVCCGQGINGECCGNPDVVGDYEKVADTSPQNGPLIARAPEMADTIAALTARVEELEKALSGVLWMADEWFKHGGDETTFADDYEARLEAARAAITKGESNG